jgi:hypothetical protein
MKATATKNARKREALTMPESRLAVLEIFTREKAKAPQQDALHYLAKELMRLTLEASMRGNAQPVIPS